MKWASLNLLVLDSNRDIIRLVLKERQRLLGVIDVRKHQVGVNCLGSKPHKSTNRLVDTEVQQQWCSTDVYVDDKLCLCGHFGISLPVMGFSIDLSSDCFDDDFACLTFCDELTFLLPSPPTTPQYTAVRELTARFVCDPSCELPPLPTLWRLRGHNTDSYFSYKSTQKYPKHRKH